MPRARNRVCSVPGCPSMQPEAQCPAHRRAHEHARGSKQQRGYDSAHDAERRRWLPKVRTGRHRCWRCGHLIAATAEWDLGHDDTDRTKYRGPEHVACNRATAGR